MAEVGGDGATQKLGCYVLTVYGWVAGWMDAQVVCTERFMNG